MYTENWFKLHRKIFENGIWDDLKLFRFFVYLIGQTVFAKKGVNKGDVHIGRGQLLKSYRKIQDELEYIENNSVKQYSLSVIKRMIAKLKNEGMIETEKTRLGTLFTIINYAKYQDKEGEKDKKIKVLRTELEQHKNSRRTVEEQQRNNKKKVKNVKNEKEKENTSCSDSDPNDEIKFDTDSKPYKVAMKLKKLIKEKNNRQPVPDDNPEDMEKWSTSMDRANRLGPPGGNKGYSWEEIDRLIEWCQQDEFWSGNILSAPKFREKIVKLENKMEKSSNNKSRKVVDF